MKEGIIKMRGNLGFVDHKKDFYFILNALRSHWRVLGEGVV